MSPNGDPSAGAPPGAADLAAEGVSWGLRFASPWPPGLTIAILAGLLALVVWLYLREAGRVGPLWRAAMAALRLAALAVLAVMLSGLSLARFRTGQPTLAVVVDRSGSMAVADAVAAKAASPAEPATAGASRLALVQRFLTEKQSAVLRQLARGRKLAAYSLADSAVWLPSDAAGVTSAVQGLRPDGPASRLGDGLTSVLDDLRGRSPTAIVLFSDGINTSGRALLEAAEAAKSRGVPLVAVGVGDDTPPRDLELVDVLADEAVFTGDTVNFQLELRQQGLSGQKIEVRLRRPEAEEPLAKETVSLDEQGLRSVLLSHQPAGAGRQTYLIEALPASGEPNLDNNRKLVEVDVRDERVQVLYVQGPPSFEYRFLKSLLERDERLELACVLQEADLEASAQDRVMRPSFPMRAEELEEFDVIVWGDVDPGGLPPGALAQVRELVVDRGRGLAWSAGPRHNPASYAGSPLEALVPAKLDSLQAEAGDVLDEPLGMAPGEQFAAAPFLQFAGAKSAEAFAALPPVFWRVAAGELRPAARVYARFAGEQGPGAPAIYGQYVGAGEVVFVATDETWRWRRREHEGEYARFWVQLVRYLARAKLRAGGEGLELSVDKDEYEPGETVWLRARYRNESQAPTEERLAVRLRLPDGREEEVLLERRGGRGNFAGSLRLDAPGRYEAQATGQAERPSTADFTVRPPPGETDRTTADFQALAEAASVSGGKFYRLSDAGRLARDLPAGRAVPLEPLPAAPLWNRWPLLLAFVLLLSGEWLLRKRQGLA
jgi:hypothetical protein